MDFWGLYLSRNFLEFSPKPVYSTMVAEKFQIYSVKTTANTFVSQKIESVQFYSCPQAKLSPRLLSLSSRQTGIAHFPEQYFKKIFFPEQKEEEQDYGVKKITKISKGIRHKFW